MKYPQACDPHEMDLSVLLESLPFLTFGWSDLVQASAFFNNNASQHCQTVQIKMKGKSTRFLAGSSRISANDAAGSTSWTTVSEARAGQS